MEFSQQAGRDRYRGEDDDEQDAPGTSRCPAGFPPPSSPSTSSSSPPSTRRWAQQGGEASDDPSGGGVDTPTVADDEHPLVPGDQVEKEHMFDKVVTPSDVGKLNRLVIPKQHAERFFPLDSSSNERGLLLNFEDRDGKPWRFRYSYWNSSQSYVMTKGWSRFVKEKRLDAGDTVSFGRGVGEAARDRLFIDWKHRPESSHDPSAAAFPRLPLLPGHHYNQMLSFGNRSVMPWVFSPPPASVIPAMPVYDHRRYTAVNPPPYLYLRSPAGGPSQIGVQYVGGMSTGARGSAGDGAERSSVVYDSVPVAHNNIIANSKTVRLFGVNFDCSSSSSATSPDGIGLGLGHGETAAASQVRRPLLPDRLSLELSLGASTADTTTVEAQSQSRDKQPMCLDF